jgi:hypothetical protein
MRRKYPTNDFFLSPFYPVCFHDWGVYQRVVASYVKSTHAKPPYNHLEESAGNVRHEIPSMSNCDYRDRPAYSDADWPRYTNRTIQKWWTPSHDKLLEDLIGQWQWHWYWEVADAIVARLPSDALTSYMNVQNWHNNLMYFAVTRAQDLGLTARIRKPAWKVCALCKERFIENSLPHPLVLRLGMDRLDFCAPCLRDTALQGSGAGNLSPDQIKTYIRDLTDALQRIPPQAFGEGVNDCLDMTSAERLAVLQVLKRKPTLRCVKNAFHSWLEALIASGVLADDALRTVRGIHCLAKDGHLCLSLGEKTVDEFLTSRALSHTKEPLYPEGNYRADFAVGNVLIEYFGLAGDPNYDSRTKEKIRICQNHGVRLIPLFAADLTSIAKLESKLIALSRTGDQ